MENPKLEELLAEAKEKDPFGHDLAIVIAELARAAEMQKAAAEINKQTMARLVAMIADMNSRIGGNHD